MARPKLQIDPDQVEKMAMIGCPVTEIAMVLGCSTDTLHNRFSAQLDKGRAKKCTRLRQLAFQSAERGNIAMQIFLLKNYCGLSDKTEVSHTGQITENVNVQANIQQLVSRYSPDELTSIIKSVRSVKRLSVEHDASKSRSESSEDSSGNTTPE